MIGNEKLKMTVAADIYCSKNSHAYIIEGPAGSGKHTAAHLIARALLCKRESDELFPCGKCSFCRKASEGVSTDIITLGREGRATIGIDTIRKMKETLSFAPVESSHKVYIIEDADCMTVAAQNSFLLALEEPPEFVVFVLLCTDASSLLGTVRSRAPVIKMELFSADFISDYLKSCPEFDEYARDGSRLIAVAEASRGSIGSARTLITGGDAEVIAEAELCDRILPLLLSLKLSDRLDASRLFPTKRDELISCLKTLLIAVRDILCAKRSDAEMLHFPDRKRARALGASCGTKRLEALYDETAKQIDALSANASPNSCIMLLATRK